MKDKYFKIPLPHGHLFLYGDAACIHVPKLAEWINDDTITCVEEVCCFCKLGNIKICHMHNHTLMGLIEFLRIFRLTKKYHIRGTYSEFYDYTGFTSLGYRKCSMFERLIFDWTGK